MKQQNSIIGELLASPESTPRNVYCLYARNQLCGGIAANYMELHLSDLPDEFIIKLSDPFRRKLFAGLNSLKASQEMGISRSFFYHLKNNRHGFRLSTLRKFSEISDIPLNEMEAAVTEIVSNRGGRILINFPIVESPSLAGLVGHCFGDGNISSKKAEFDYVNGDMGLINSVISEVEILFSAQPTYFGPNGDGTYKVNFSNLIGKILALAGAPRGKKVYSTMTVPGWIMEGSFETRRAFLRALFDDDGSVLFSLNYAAKNVNLHFTRVSSIDENFVRYLNDLRALLLSLGINSSRPYIARKYYVGGSERLVRGFVISRFEDRQRYFSLINFSQVIKKKRLAKICAG